MAAATSSTRVSAPVGPPDIYWTKYEGPVPEGAIVCGSTDGESVYAGRCYIVNELLIGTAFLKRGVCVVARNGVLHESTHFEVMCVPVGEPLGWEKADPDTTIPKKLLLKAGKLDDGTIIYVARITDQDCTFIGWVDLQSMLAHIPMDRKENVCTEYEILIHKFLEFLCICPPCIPSQPE